MIRFLTALFFLVPTLATAQESWPVYANTYVNDYAEVMDAGVEERITRNLKSLREDLGVEVTVLTLPTRQGFTAGGSLEDFATGLFNAWGVGDANRNDGILILVLTNDRDMRVELGSGYGSAFDREAKDIIDRVFLPEFRAGNYSNGIEDGTDAVITRIARVHAEGAQPSTTFDPAQDNTGSIIGWIIGIIAAGSALTAVFSRKIIDRVTRCPNCGERGISTFRNRISAPTRSSTGRGEKTIDCAHCGFHNVTPYVIPMVSSSSSSSSGGSFGGGSSSGGGASGSW